MFELLKRGKGRKSWAEKRELQNNEQVRSFMRGLASKDALERMEYSRAFAAELGPVIRDGVFDGSNVQDIYNASPVLPGSQIDYPLHFISPGTEKDYVAYTMSRTGDLPTRLVQGDRIFLNTYWIANSIEIDLPYVRDANWDVMGAAMQVLEDGFVKKINDDGWHTILGAGLDRGILVFDSAGTDGVLSRKLVSLMKIAMIRNGGGNMGTMNRPNLTDLYVSHEAIEDLRNHTAAQHGDITRSELTNDPEGTILRLHGVNIHPMDEFGVGQEYQDYWTNTLSGTMNGSDEEIVVGLDLSRSPNPFYMPVREDLEIFADENAFYENKVRWGGRMELGMANLDSRSVIIGSF